MEGAHYVYVLSNWSNRILYTGLTDNLQQRMKQHKAIEIDDFSRQYHVCKLVYFERLESREAAMLRLDEIKSWQRTDKQRLIENSNPAWRDLSRDWMGVREDDLEDIY